ncbi:unnamed protein product [Lactuca virosa]|uniref:Uncharacterized protein n=1 Tax=Lactuca virosa TaxID=75947 RepID=A0AAU9MNZ4_9ASTR|nr:unnamed protein product [Lactuca virosa]
MEYQILAVKVRSLLMLPLLRWKRDPALAAMSVWSLQGAIIPILFNLHAQTMIHGRPLLVSKHVIFVSGIMSIYAVVAALFKDIPDVEGDKINGVNSLALKVGTKPVFWLCIGLLEMAYGMAILIGLLSTGFWTRSMMVIGHSILGFTLWREANLVDLKNNEAIESFYLFIWKIVISTLWHLHITSINLYCSYMVWSICWCPFQDFEHGEASSDVCFIMGATLVAFCCFILAYARRERRGEGGREPVTIRNSSTTDDGGCWVLLLLVVGCGWLFPTAFGKGGSVGYLATGWCWWNSTKTVGVQWILVMFSGHKGGGSEWFTMLKSHRWWFQI